MTTAEIDLQTLPPFSTYAQVLELLQVTEPHLRGLIREGNFPAPIFLSPRTPRFRRSDLVAFFEEQAVSAG